MKFMSGYPGWFFPLLLCLISLMIISGLLLIPTFLFFTLDFDVSFYLESVARKIVIFAHVLSGLFLTAAIGALIMVHVKSGWRRRINHVSGFVAIAAYLLLLLTAAGALYFGGETVRLSNNSVHVVIGLIFSFIIVFHVIKGVCISVSNQSLEETQCPVIES